MSRAAKGADCKSAGYAFVGSSPTSPTTIGSKSLVRMIAFRGCSSMVEQQPSKLMTRVRFPSPAPSFRCPETSLNRVALSSRRVVAETMTAISDDIVALLSPADGGRHALSVLGASACCIRPSAPGSRNRVLSAPDKMNSEQLKHLALIAHRCYRSFDLAVNCMRHFIVRAALPSDSVQRYLTIVRPSAAPT